MAEGGSKGAKMALKLLDKYDKVITTILIGNNIVNITASSLATVLATAVVGPDNAALVSTVVLTLVILTFGEVLPKSLAKDHSEGMTVATSGIITFLTFFFTPLSALFILLKKLADKLFGNKKEVSVTEQELMAIIDEIEDEGVLEEQERDLVKSALQFDETVVDEIITHRVDVVAVDINEDIEKVRDIFINEEYSRLPVYEGSIDPTITGSFGNVFTYKNFKLNVFMTYAFGNVIRLDPVFKSSYSDLTAMPKEFKNRWTVQGDEAITNVPVIADARLLNNDNYLSYAYNAYNYSTERVAKGDFIRMKEISLSYDFPAKLIQPLKLTNLSLKLQATNLFLIYSDKKLNGQDPEFFNSGGVASPMPKQFTLTVRLGL